MTPLWGAGGGWWGGDLGGEEGVSDMVFGVENFEPISGFRVSVHTLYWEGIGGHQNQHRIMMSWCYSTQSMFSGHRPRFGWCVVDVCIPIPSHTIPPEWSGNTHIQYLSIYTQKWAIWYTFCYPAPPPLYTCIQKWDHIYIYIHTYSGGYHVLCEIVSLYFNGDRVLGLPPQLGNWTRAYILMLGASISIFSNNIQNTELLLQLLLSIRLLNILLPLIDFEHPKLPFRDFIGNNLLSLKYSVAG